MKLAHSAVTLLLAAGMLPAQGLDPAKLLQPPTDTWPTYSGDYTGRRFSPLTKINTGNVKNLSLAWLFRLPQGLQASALKATPLEVNGVLYFTIPDHVWAIDARSGREIWHHVHRSSGGIHLGNRG